MSEEPRKTESEEAVEGEEPRTEATELDQDTVDQPTVDLKRAEADTQPLLEDEPAEYELPEPAPRRADSAEDEPDAEIDAPVSDDPGLPTSDPVFPTASPQLRPPSDVSGFGAPGGPPIEEPAPEPEPASKDDMPEPKPASEGGTSSSTPAQAASTATPAKPANTATAAQAPSTAAKPASPAAAGPVGAPAPAGSPTSVGAAGARVARPMPPRQRSAAEIRADIEAGRQELSQSVEQLRDRVEELTDWRGQIRKHRREITIVAAAVGFAVGARFMMRRRRR